MNIALFASAFHPYVGGVEEHCRQIAHAYLRQGHQPIVLTNRWPRAMTAYEEFEGIPVYRLAFRAPEGGAKARVTYAMSTRRIRRETLSILRQHAIDVMHVHCVSANAYYATIAKAAARLPMVVTTHGEVSMDATGVFQRSAFMNGVLRDALTAADAVTACSQHTLDEVQAYVGYAFERSASVVYNGIRTEDFAGAAAFDHPRPYLLGIGRMVRQKGFDVLLRAYAILPENKPDLLLAGDGPELAGLRELSAQLGLQDRVHFVGKADRRMAVSLFVGCELFVLPSRLEPMGIVNLEAMAAGKVVIASKVGGVPEVVLDEATGLLVEPENPAVLANAIGRLLADQPLRDRLGRAGRERAEQFTWDSAAEQYLKLYEQIRARVAQWI